MSAAALAPDASASDAAVPSRIVLEAIATRQCLLATYNRGAVKLAPHILYTRHDEVYVDAVTVERDGQPPRERKLGSFKLTGLGDLRVSGPAFVPDAGFDPGLDRYEGATLFTV